MGFMININEERKRNVESELHKDFKEYMEKTRIRLIVMILIDFFLILLWVARQQHLYGRVAPLYYTVLGLFVIIELCLPTLLLAIRAGTGDKRLLWLSLAAEMVNICFISVWSVVVGLRWGMSSELYWLDWTLMAFVLVLRIWIPMYAWTHREAFVGRVQEVIVVDSHSIDVPIEHREAIYSTL
ncbi:hypothetical protein PROFUN_05045 [Planoprotostelium fungivorum]|uniref:Transmembrane protein n=1 Tax=Planoprotostelium fungivorum TaxID=1890364 RepID=A0A2P6NSH7_9EUKA|nr:hypothetical protein PROFUN_05045 [Planoprotostelium fungivorum]